MSKKLKKKKGMIQKIREERQLTQIQMAELMGCKQSAVSKMEFGKMKPTVENIYNIWIKLGLTNYQLMKLTIYYGESKGEMWVEKNKK